MTLRIVVQPPEFEVVRKAGKALREAFPDLCLNRSGSLAVRRGRATPPVDSVRLRMMLSEACVFVKPNTPPAYDIPVLVPHWVVKALLLNPEQIFPAAPAAATPAAAPAPAAAAVELRPWRGKS